MIALTRAVSLRIAECELAHLARTPINVKRARPEHDVYEGRAEIQAAFDAAGLSERVRWLEPGRAIAVSGPARAV